MLMTVITLPINKYCTLTGEDILHGEFVKKDEPN